MSTWLLLRGLMRESRHWGDFLPQFAAQFPTSQIITADFAGNGSLSHLRSATRVEQMLQQLRADLRQAGHMPPYDVLALSLGAMVALAWAAHYPQEIRQMVLINTSVRPYSRFYQRLRPSNYWPLLSALLRADTRHIEQVILRRTSQLLAEDTQKKIVDTWHQYALQHPVARKNILRQLLAALRFRAAAHAPTYASGQSLPILLLAAQRDTLVSVACSRSLARHWGLPIQIHPSAGHDLPLDDAAWVLQQIKQWIAGKP